MSKSWISFREIPNPKRLTQKWLVVSRSSGTTLGRIAWHSPWRKYTFFPDEDTIWSPDCLADVANFCTEQTKSRKS